MFPRLSAFDYKDCKLFPNFFCGICCPIDLTRACTGQRKSRKNTEQMKDEIGNYKLQPQTGCSLVRSHWEPWCFLGSQHLTTKAANFSQTFFATFCHPSLDTGMHPTTAMSLHSNALSDIMFPPITRLRFEWKKVWQIFIVFVVWTKEARCFQIIWRQQTQQSTNNQLRT